MKEQLTFTGEDSPIANLMLSVMGAFAEFERSFIKERQREGISLTKKRGVYKGRKRSLSQDEIIELNRRVGQGDKKVVENGGAGLPKTSHLSLITTEK